MPEQIPPVSTILPSAALGRLDMEQWSLKAVALDDLELARLLAGLDDARLDRLEHEFAAHPRRPRKDPWRFGYSTAGGCALVALLAGVLGAIDGGLHGPGASPATVILLLSLIGLAGSLGAGILGAWHLVPRERGWARVGTYVSRIDECHPWLYVLHQLCRDPVADAYRRRVLEERGVLRGLDHVLAQETVKAHEALERTRTAVAIRHALSGHKTPASGLTTLRPVRTATALPRGAAGPATGPRVEPGGEPVAAPAGDGLP